MKKVDLKKVNQKGKEFFVFIEDPRLIVELLPEVEAGEVQVAQRPWIKKKVKEISSYVAGKLKMSDGYKALGIIPNNPILALNRPLEIKTEKLKFDCGGDIVEEVRYYFLLPENEVERESYIGSIEAIDGQHRLLAFKEGLRDPTIKDSMTYQMVFSIFKDLSINERKELFLITNEKQEKVSTNLIRLLKKALGLLGEDESIYDVIESLNKEPYSVLHKRIIFGSEKITKGYKENQVSKIFKAYGIFDCLEKYGNNEIDKMTKLLSNYLKAWESSFEVSFQSPEKETITKISGLRYILCLFPEVMKLLVDQRKHATEENFVEIVSEIPIATVLDNVFEDEATSLAFRGEGATVKLAKEHAKMLEKYINGKTDQFDPTSGI